MKIITLGVLLVSHLAFAHLEGKVQMPKEFDTLKKLVGTWEGTTEMGGKAEKITVTYRMTSGGTAIEENLFPGTLHEMVSMYHKEGNTLGMVHFCSRGNQPHMVLKKADDKTLTFEMTKPIGISSPKEPHMHGITLTLADDSHLKQEWTNFENGKKDEMKTFNFVRK